MIEMNHSQWTRSGGSRVRHTFAHSFVFSGRKRTIGWSFVETYLNLSRLIANQTALSPSLFHSITVTFHSIAGIFHSVASTRIINTSIVAVTQRMSKWDSSERWILVELMKKLRGWRRRSLKKLAGYRRCHRNDWPTMEETKFENRTKYRICTTYTENRSDRQKESDFSKCWRDDYRKICSIGFYLVIVESNRKTVENNLSYLLNNI